jgi:hypothetical protein
LVAANSTRADFADSFRELFEPTAQTPHPSVVQVLAPEPGAISRGSGTLIHADGQYGYVITNWHVVRDAPSDVFVIFPDGQQSLARIVKTNDDWDLALLLIWRGTTQPMPLSAVGPQPGETLTIAGYGGEGRYRAARGVFTTFAAPEPNMPYEMFEVSVAARQGDSGGPIINERGELAGVLFGAGDGRTTGTQVGRVRTFVNEAFGELNQRGGQVAAAQVRPPVAHDATRAVPDSWAPERLASAPQVDQQPGWKDAEVPQQYHAPFEPASPSPQLANQRLPYGQDGAARHGMPPDLARADLLPQQPAAQFNGEYDVPIGPPVDPPPLDRREFPDIVSDNHSALPPHVASIPGDPDETRRPEIDIPARHPQIRPRAAGGITWGQLKNFFAAVGVFAVLNTLTQHLFTGGRKR